MDSDDWKEYREGLREKRDKRAQDALELIVKVRSAGYRVHDAGIRYEITSLSDGPEVRLYFYPKGDKLLTPKGNKWRSNAAAWIRKNLLNGTPA